MSEVKDRHTCGECGYKRIRDDGKIICIKHHYYSSDLSEGVIIDPDDEACSDFEPIGGWHDKYWWFGENSLWCKLVKWLGRPKWCLYPTPPEPEYVTVKICDLCNKLAVAGCLVSGHSITITYVKGEEPTEKCVPSTCCQVPAPPPPPTIHKLDKAKQYTPGKKLLSPILEPSFGFNAEINDDDAEAFMDKFAEQGWGNFMRIFVAGNWEPDYIQKHRPYTKLNGKYHLEIKNFAHFHSIWRRGTDMVERYIKPMISLMDNCSLKTRKPGHWKTHWMNGNNNVNKTSTEAYSQTHWYEYNGLPPHSSPEVEVEGMRETGKRLMELYGYVLEKAKEYWGDFFLIEILNEGDAGIIYHQMLAQFAKETLNQGNLNGRLFSSMEHDSLTDPDYNFYGFRGINKVCIPIIHKCQTYKEYQIRKELVKKGGEYMRHGASADGRPPLKTAAETKDNVLSILKSDSQVYEGNLRSIEWSNICGGNDWTFKNFKFELFDAFGKAFNEYLG